MADRFEVTADRKSLSLSILYGTLNFKNPFTGWQDDEKTFGKSFRVILQE